MAGTTAAPWSIGYPEATDEVKVYPAEGQAIAERISAIFKEKVPIYKAYAGPATLKTGEWADQGKTGETFTMPAVGTANQYIITSSTVAEAKLTTAAKFVGGGLSSSTAILTTGMVAVWMSDGTNWRLLAGEVKREQKYVTTEATKAAAEAGVTPSATRPAFVSLSTGGTTMDEVTIGGVFNRVGEKTYSFYCPAGQAWTTDKAVEIKTVLL